MSATRKLQEKKNNSEALDLYFETWHFESREGCWSSELCSADLEFHIQYSGV